jgi:hypothetical protein
LKFEELCSFGNGPQYNAIRVRIEVFGEKLREKLGIVWSDFRDLDNGAASCCNRSLQRLQAQNQGIVPRTA